jgi:hypothetical protein
MAWYKTGTVSVVNGETSIAGTGTKFASNSRVGDGFRGPDGEWYEIVNIASETVLGIFPAYEGGTVSADANYMIAPLQGYNKESADRLREITNGMADISGDVLEAKNSAIEAKASEDAAKASEISVSADALDVSQKAAQVTTDALQVAQDRVAAQAAAVESGIARDEAVTAAGSITGTVTDRGAIDLSSGSYPAKPATSSFWRVTVGGTVSGVNYSVGDTLNYSKTTDEFYKSGGAVDSVNGKTGVVVLAKADIGLGNVDNTSDASKPVSTEQQTALDTKVDKVTGKQLSTEDYTSAEKAKLAGVDTGATANSPNATLLARANHTGTQLAATISDFADAVRSAVLTGLTAGTNVAISATDSVMVAFAKLQAQVDNKLGLTAKAADSDKLNGQLASFYTAEMGAASSGSAGTKGLVPAPAAGATTRFLSSLGTWITPSVSSAWGSITGTLSAQTDLQSALDGKLSTTMADFAIIYPNGGSAASPATLAINTRYITDNPFPGFHVIVQIELLVSAVWSDPGWDGNTGTGGSTYGTIAAQSLPSDKVIVQTGTNAVASASNLLGGGHGITSTTPVTSAPCRVKVWKLKGAVI